MKEISPLTHGLMLVFLVVVVLTTRGWGLRSSENGSGRMIGLGMIAVWIAYNAYYFHPAIFEWRTSLPLQLCDLLAIMAGVALVWRTRIARSFLYFSALLFAGQAIATPVGNQDPSTLRFWLYWILHAGIISCWLFDLSVRGYRPTMKDYLQVAGVELVYAAVIFPVNLAFGWNYAYIGNAQPEGATAIDWFGPWPQRVPLMILAALFLQGVMLLPWKRRRAAHR
ncbi:MAG TPA: TIGR02206 family membrane protein [Opitutaceae bacterium]|nr:TIGR02206 family membrane protein [Opitutaceae bacterium]